jgi:hypothetical protein
MRDPKDKKPDITIQVTHWQKYDVGDEKWTLKLTSITFHN